MYLDLSETDAKAYMLTDNKLTENTEWDFPKLADLFVELDGLNVDLDLTGFSADEIADFVAPDGLPKDNGPVSKMITCPECGHEFEG